MEIILVILVRSGLMKANFTQCLQIIPGCPKPSLKGTMFILKKVLGCSMIRSVVRNWNLWEAKPIPLIVGATRPMKNNSSRYLQSLPGSLNSSVVSFSPLKEVAKFRRGLCAATYVNLFAVCSNCIMLHLNVTINTINIIISIQHNCFP